MSEPLVMAIDAGTGSCRAIIFDVSGREVGAAQTEWTHLPEPGVPGSFVFDTATNGGLVDQVILNALSAAGVKRTDIRAVSVTSMREGMVLYDADGRELWACPNIDSRGSLEAEELVRDGHAARIFAISGDWVSITAPARLRWLSRHRPQIMERTRHMGMLSDWLATRLTHNYFTEATAASSSAMFDLARRAWSNEIIDLCGFDPAIFPEVVEPGRLIGKLTAAAARRTGLMEGTPVVAGGADTQLALLGLAVRPGQGTLVGGSFWQMTAVIDRPIIDAARMPRTLCHARPGEWMIELIGFLSGLALRWFRDGFCETEMHAAQARNTSAFSLMEELAAQVPPGANGVLAVLANVMRADSWVHAAPSLLQFDFNNPRGSGRAAAIRAIMEAAAYVSAYHRNDIERVAGLRFDSLQFTGGGAHGRLWQQLIADVMGVPVNVPKNRETTALGCAMLAAVGCGFYRDLDEARAMATSIERCYDPDPVRHEQYLPLLDQWRQVDDAMVRLAEANITRPMWRAAGALPRI
jgi:autoinducer-2 kinase